MPVTKINYRQFSTDLPANDELGPVRMRDGTIVTNVPKSATKAQIYEAYNRANGYESVGLEEPSFFTKTGDFFKDMLNAAQEQVPETTTNAIATAITREQRMLAPEFTASGEFKGFKRLSKEDTVHERQRAAKVWADINYSTDRHKAAELIGSVGSHIFDPINMAALAVGGPTASMQRLVRIFGTEFGLGVSTDIAQQVNEGKGAAELKFDRALNRGLLQGGMAGGADYVLGLALVGLSRASSRDNHSATNKLLDRLEKEFDQNIQDGLHPEIARERALSSVGKTMPEIRAAKRVLDKQVDLRGRMLASGGIKKKYGIVDRAIHQKNKLSNAIGEKVHLPKTGNYLFQPLSSAIKDKSVVLFGRVRRHDFNVLGREGIGEKEIADFLRRGEAKSVVKDSFDLYKLKGDHTLLSGRKINKEEYLNGLLQNGDYRVATKWAVDNGMPKLAQAIRRVETYIKKTGSELVDQGILKEVTENYYPRYVKDVEGLKKAIGHTRASNIEASVRKATEKKGAPLNELELSEVINRYILKNPKNISNMERKITAKRTVDLVPEHLLKYYHDLNSSLIRYVDDSSKLIERNKLFGIKANAGANMHDAVPKLIAREVKAGRMTLADIEDKEISSLLTSRFVAGPQIPSPHIQKLRNLFYMLTLGQFRSSVQQLSDIGLSAFKNGFFNTMRGVVDAVLGRGMRAEELNLTRKVSEEFASHGGMAKALATVLRLNGFKTIDRIGKDVNLNAAVRQAFKLSRTEKGLKALQQEWGEVFGKEYPLLIKELQAGQITDRVKFLAFNKLADIQPITLSEMPQAWLQMKNGRILYALNSFTLKQLNIVRNDIVRQILHGDRAHGIRNLVAYSTLFGGSNMMVLFFKDLMSGKVDNTPDRVKAIAVDSMWKNFGGSQYLADMAADPREKASAAVANFLFPVLGMADMLKDAGKDVNEIFKDTPDYAKATHTLRRVPLFGQPLYDWVGGGIEKREEREKKDKRAAMRERYGFKSE